MSIKSTIVPLLVTLALTMSPLKSEYDDPDPGQSPPNLPPNSSNGSGTKLDPYIDVTYFFDELYNVHRHEEVNWSDYPEMTATYPPGYHQSQMIQGEYEIYAVLNGATFNEIRETARPQSTVLDHAIARSNFKKTDTTIAFVDATNAWYETILVRGYYELDDNDQLTFVRGRYNAGTNQWIAFTPNIRKESHAATLNGEYGPCFLNYTKHDLQLRHDFEDQLLGLHSQDRASFSVDFNADSWTYSFSNLQTPGADPVSHSGTNDSYFPVPSWITDMAFYWPHRLY